MNQLQHLSLIPDGNGRWATQKGWSRHTGHRQGYIRILEILRHCMTLGIPHVTIYTLSLDNLKRQHEILFLSAFLKRFCLKDIHFFHEKNCIFNPIGNYHRFKHPSVISAIQFASNLTRENTGMVINFATAYSGLEDIAQSVIKTYRESNFNLPENPEELQQQITRHSYLNLSPPVDLCIRLGGETRLSNYCLWQLAYAEFQFLETLWPNFTPALLDQCIKEYHQRDRRFGKAAT